MKFDTGDTAFMLLAAGLVMLMTPGLAFFYGGLVGRKNVLAIMMQSFVSIGITTVLWITVGYSMCFSGSYGHGDFHGIIGNFNNVFLHGITPTTALAGNGTIPVLVYFAYQMMFAIITPALITGAFANRVNFKAYLIFLIAWLLFVYFPIVHMVWGGGYLNHIGVLDFAGGIGVHLSAGMAALGAVFFVGKRKVEDIGPHNIPLVALGTVLLWFGWYGFNAGSELKVDGITGLAFVNTDIAASFAAVVWLFLAWAFEKKPKMVGLLTGAVAGLVTITPCAGYVSTTSAIFIGCISSVVCYCAVHIQNKLGWWDDALDVWAVHGVGGLLGTICLGIFASLASNAAGANGLLLGNTSFFIKQTVAALVMSVYAFGFTFVMLKVINLFTPVSVTDEHQESGLDEALHGEVAYA